MITSDDLENILANPDAYVYLIRDVQDIFVYSRFPSLRPALEAIFESKLKQLSSSKKFGRYVTDLLTFQELVKLFPKHEEKLFKKLLRLYANPDNCNFPGREALLSLAQQFPHQKKELYKNLLEFLLAKPRKAKKYITDADELLELARMFPKRGVELIEKLTRDKRSITDLICNFEDNETKDLIAVATFLKKHKSSRSAIKLIDRSMSTLNFFGEVVRDFADLVMLESFLEKCKSVRTLAKLNEMADQELGKLLMHTSGDQFVTMLKAKKTDEYLGFLSRCIEEILSNDRLFKHFFKKNSVKKYIKNRLPENHILQRIIATDSRLAAQRLFAKHQALAQIGNVSRVFGQALRGQHTLFSKLPPKALLDMARFTADSQIVSKQEAKVKMEKNLDKPTLPGKKSKM